MMRIIDPEGTAESPHQEVVSRLPLGRYLLTAAHGGSKRGLLVDRVQRCADDPPTVLVSVRKGHALSPLIRDAASFGLCEIPTGDRIISRLFSRPTDLQDEDPFLGHQLIEPGQGDSPIPACCASWMTCELLRHLDIEADFEIYIGRILDSGIIKASESSDSNGSPRKTESHERPGVDNATPSSKDQRAKRSKRATA